MADYGQYYQMSLEALIQWIKEYKDIPTEKVWNRLAGAEGYLTSQSLSFISQMKFADLSKTIYKDIQKNKEKK